MGISRREFLGSLAAGATAMALPSGESAWANDEAYPKRYIKLLVPYPATGTAPDLHARIFAEPMSARLGQRLVVENRGGAGGTLGADFVAKSEPDGYTLFLTTVGAVAITPHMRADMPYHPLRDFAPVTLVVRNTTVMVVRSENPIKTTSGHVTHPLAGYNTCTKAAAAAVFIA